MNRFEQMKDRLKQGVKIQVAPLLYPTPDRLALRMVDFLECDTAHTILEPSAGLGALLDAVNMSRQYSGVRITAVEQDWNLVKHLRDKDYIGVDILHMDFLQFSHQHKFDRIIMNPPFNGAGDIKHIKRALSLLRPDGRLVAICANGPRQSVAFKDLSEHWEVLPAGTFEQVGTMVNTVLMVVQL